MHPGCEPMASHLVPGPANDGGEDGSGGVIPGEARLAQARAVVTHQGSAFLIVTHGCFGFLEERSTTITVFSEGELSLEQREKGEGHVTQTTNDV